MNKIITLAAFIAFSTSIWSQNIINGNDPTHIADGMGIYYDSIIVLGFSPDSNIAYLEYHNGDAIAYWTLSVKSLVTDEVLFHNNWNDDGYIYESADYKILLDKESEYLKSIYSKFNISFSPDIKISSFPIISTDNRYNAELIKTDIPTIEYLEQMGLQSSSVDILVSSSFGNKTIGSYEQHKNSKVFGYIKSPFEERIAVFILKASLGFEASTSHSFLIYGCSLKYGFE